MNYSYDVSIILVNYKTSNLVSDVIKSIKEKSHDFSYEIIIVDNSENKFELDKLKAFENEFIHVLDAKSNLGFGKANNLGATIAQGKYLYFLNTDTLLMNNSIFVLKDYLDKNPNVGIVGSNLYTRDGKPNHSFWVKEKNLKNEKRMNSIISLVRNRIFKRRIDFNFSGSPKKIQGYVCGASLMVRHDLFVTLDGFDKDIFMYAEESLLCYRLIHELNMEIYNVPDSKIIHFEGGSNSIENENHFIMAVDGNYIYYLKIFGKEKALQYLKNEIKHCNQNIILSKIIRDKAKAHKFVLFKQVLKEKLIEVK